MMRASLPPQILEQIEQAIASLRYGTVQITVHNAHIVQIDRIERVRFSPSTHLTAGRTQQHSPTDRTSGGVRRETGR